MKGELIPVRVPLVSCANMLTQNITNLFGEVDDADKRMLAHLNKDLESKFYKVAFCQNGQLLATPTQSPAQLNFGVNMQALSDYSSKVFMPITKQLVTKITSDQNAYDFMQKHRQLRMAEIHPPRVELGKVQQAVAHWSPIEAFEHPPQVQGRTFKVCMAMKSVRDPDRRVEDYLGTKEKVQAFNAKYGEIGHCTTFVAFDTVFVKLCMFTDKLDALQKMLSVALTKSDQPCSGKS
jgi:hypothetical protein